MTKKRAVRALMAGGVAAAVGLGALAGASPASAYIGTDDYGGGTGGSGLDASAFILVTGDDFARRTNPFQGWGQASIDFWVNQIDRETSGDISQKNIHEALDKACGGALDKAIARSNGQAKRARVVGIYMALGKGKNGKWVTWGANGGSFKKNWPKMWDASSAKNDFPGYSAKQVQEIYDAGAQQVNATAAKYPSGSRAICIALNELEPAGYELEVATAAQGSPGVAGGTQAVHDQIRTSAKGTSVKESLKASVVLNWDGYYGSKAKAVTKTMDISSIGTANSPTFTPKDFGWTSWAAGKYWYDIKVARQKAMAKAVDTPDRVASETFTLDPPPPVKTMHDIKQGFAI